jgi:hypothetical protein
MGEDPLAPMRGMVNGVLLGLFMWLALGAAVVVASHYW